MNEIIVNASTPYKIVIGKDLIENIGDHMPPCKVCLVTDETVDGIYGRNVLTHLEASGFSVIKVVFPEGEKTKSIDSLEVLLETLASKEFTRSDMLIALGGGVIGDLTGFAASTYCRGIKYIQVPTTLLASVDSSVGGKTAINLTSGKNLAGTFWQPSSVIIDTNCIKTLPKEIFLDGFAEIIKTAMLESKDFFEKLKSSPIEDLICKSVDFKRHIVEKDERDTGLRQLLNLGHTPAHGIETLSNYKIHHGQSVALGLLIVTKASRELGWSKEDCYTPLRDLLLDFGYNIDCPFSYEDIYKVALNDKKRKGDLVTLIIPEKIGSCFLKEVSLAELKEFFKVGLDK